MKITNKLKNPTIQFSQLHAGDVFMTLAGDIYIKLDKPSNRWGNQSSDYNSYSINMNNTHTIEPTLEIVPIEVELILKRNTYEDYVSK